MATFRLPTISYLFPWHTATEQRFFAALAEIFAPLRGATVGADKIVLTPTNPAAAWPITILQSADIGFPQVIFEMERPLDLPLGRFYMGHKPRSGQPPVANAPQTADLLTAAELATRLAGHITRIDHTGVNIPVTMLDTAGWQQLLAQLSDISALYNYPTGEAWPFILPTTAEEFETDIHQFVRGREPKFELVYDQWATFPVLQFSLETDFSYDQAAQLFPKPYGEVFPDLGDIFRTVYVTHPWPELIIRFDLNYAGDGTLSSWDSGEWLVTEGGRIR